jgi:hypothetical protein
LATAAPEFTAGVGTATTAPAVEYWNIPGATTAAADTATAVTDYKYLNIAAPSPQTSSSTGEATPPHASAAEPEAPPTEDEEAPPIADTPITDAEAVFSADDETTTETATASTNVEYWNISAPSDVDVISHALPYNQCFDGICDNTKAVVTHLMSFNASTNVQCRDICASTTNCDFSSFCPTWDPDCLAEGTAGTCALYDGCLKNETHAWLVKDDGWSSCPKLAETR